MRIFEPDEERNYRGVIPYEDVKNRKNVEVELIKSIASSIKQLVFPANLSFLIHL